MSEDAHLSGSDALKPDYGEPWRKRGNHGDSWLDDKDGRLIEGIVVRPRLELRNGQAISHAPEGFFQLHTRKDNANEA